MQFSLRSIFLAFVVIGSALGAFGPWGVAVGVVIVALVACYRPIPMTLTEWAVIVAIIAILIALLLPPMEAAREASRRVQCMNNLKQVALGLLIYESKYGSLPPAFVLGPDGKPWHSWRVLILPFLEQQTLYDAYSFNEPWNGPNNSKLAASIPSLYVCPSSGSRAQGAHVTNYVAVVGPRTMWPGSEPRAFAAVPDGMDNTIMVVEAAPPCIPWMEPRDLTLDELAAPGERDPAKESLGEHRWEAIGWFVVRDANRGTHVAMADGRVSVVPWKTPGEQLASLLTVDGGETVDVGKLPWAPEGTRVHWPRVLSLAALAISTVLFWFSVHPRRRSPHVEPEPPRG